MAVPLMDVAAEYRSIAHEIDDHLSKFLDSGKYTLGPYVERFEEEFAEYLGVEYCVGVSSGTDALLLSLRALGVGEGDEVITTPFTFVASADVIVRLGARPVFVDVEPGTLNVNADAIKNTINPKTAAILPVHLYGMPCDLAKLREIASETGVPVVEDAAQAAGSRYAGRFVGTFGEAGCFSFFPTKNLGAYGDGGAIVTDNAELAEEVRALRVHGAKRKNYPGVIGYKARLDAMQAAVLSVKLRYLNDWVLRKRDIVNAYRERLTGVLGVTLLEEPEGREPAYHQFTARVERRDELMEHLQSRDIGCAVYYPIPLHVTEAFGFLGHKPGDFPEAETAAAEVLSLPLFSQMTDGQLDSVCSTVEGFYRG
ncbi:MAG: DegT/DnrJ/EryC1/StrS family aminotransferase [Candidatus Coatesbacteria bacterium]|nr:MAG: DegT/DnrJ/EryC1/StrS family aminotransferase [Candidatus Coatesbacteria bacterium]